MTSVDASARTKRAKGGRVNIIVTGWWIAKMHAGVREWLVEL